MSATFVKGEQVDLLFSFELDSGLPFDLEGFVAATGLFKKQDGSALAASGGLVHSAGGQIRVVLTAEETAQLEARESANCEVVLDVGHKRIVQFEGDLTIKDSLFTV